jgi:protein phosphatase
MRSLLESLANAERLDLAAALERRPDAFPFLRALSEFPCGERSLLEHTQAVMDALLDEPPPECSAATVARRPWWRAMPAAYVAALFQHVGLPEVCSPRPGPKRLRVPHARESVRLVRDLLRGEGVPFTVREHVVALILARPKPASLVRAGAPVETYRRLSCALDLRALYHLARAELKAAPGEDLEQEAGTLEAFRERAEVAGAFGAPYGGPLPEERVRQLGFEEPRERHRALNALRYFELVARMAEGEWFEERLRQERKEPLGRLHLLVGIAGCGKSSWAREHLARTQIVSSDRMREELTGDPADQSQNYLVFQRCMDRIRDRLREGGEVTFDATNYSEKLRSAPVQAARWVGAEVGAYFFDLALSEAMARDRERRRSVPDDVIRRQHRLLEPPALYEADRHFVVDADGEARLYWPVEGGRGADGERSGA